MYNLNKYSYTGSDEKITIIQDTRNKKDKPIRTAFEKGAVENGVVVHAQALDFGDYCTMTPAIRDLLDKATENRLLDIKNDATFIDLENRIRPYVFDPVVRQRVVYELMKCISDRTSLIRGRLSAVAKADLSGLYPRAVETKWLLSELDGCIDTFEFENEMAKARRHNCSMLVLVATERYEDFYAPQIAEYVERLRNMGARFDICMIDEVFNKIYEFLLADHYDPALMQYTRGNGFHY